tara:strand:+ start:1336 stop:1740 length:405 start_codon:yes stop_codon:yes gene_type:complete
MQEKLKMISCPKCGNDFPELRKILYSYHVCVNCSTTKALVGITTVEGVGDHTYNDLIIMDQDRALGIQRHADELNGKKTPTIVEILDFDRESAEAEVTQSIKDKTKTLQEEGEEDDYDLFDPEKEQEGIEGIDY